MTTSITSRTPSWARRVVDVRVAMDWDHEPPTAARWAIPGLRHLIEIAVLALLAAAITCVVVVVLAVAS